MGHISYLFLQIWVLPSILGPSFTPEDQDTLGFVPRKENFFNGQPVRNISAQYRGVGAQAHTIQTKVIAPPPLTATVTCRQIGESGGAFYAKKKKEHVHT